MGRYAQVALPLSIDRTFSYGIPEELADQVRLGCEVLVPFRQRKVSGFVVGLSDESPKSEVKDVYELVNPQPFFGESLLFLTKWISEYYICSWGEALKAALPKGLEKRERRTVRAKQKLSPEALENLPGLERKVLQFLLASGEASWFRLSRELGKRNIGGALRRLESKGLVDVRSKIREPRTKPKTEEVFSLSRPVPGGEMEAIRKSTPRQADLLQYLLGARGGATKRQLKEALGVSSRTLNALKAREMVTVSTREVFRSPSEDLFLEAAEELLLTGEQALVLERIKESLRRGVFKSYLLYGITGSGKTEIYIRSIREAISAGKRAIVLVPEISLTPQTLAALTSRLGDSVSVLHSRLSQGERYDVWRRARAGDYRVIVGARSAVFAPLDNLGLIIVDEEHETSYKQDEPDPRYSGRDVALFRAKSEKAVCILGSATPSLESFYNAETGKSKLICLPSRVEGRDLPPVTVVDMKGSENQIFSPALLAKLRDRLRKGEQTILFLNRRGFSNFLFCQECGFVVRCPDCSVSLTHHRSEHILLCHYCGFRRPLPQECPGCGGSRLSSRGIGTERVEKELERLFPRIRVARMDVDTTSRKGAHHRIYYSFKKGEADVLLGTQMVAKGFDIPAVTLVGVISADTALNLPDFRSAERTFQLLTQVAGRTGRGELGGEVVIQTYSPDHYAIQLAKKQDYLGFYRTEIKQREELNYPPFSRLGRLVFSSPDDEETKREAESFALRLARESKESAKILGPAPAPIARVKGNYRWQVLLKAKTQSSIQRAVRTALRKRMSARVRITITIDPVDMM